MRTGYGIKKKGSSEFVIVAPHAAGDDLNTKNLAIALAKKLNASYVINTKFVKPNNKRISNQKYLEDFNLLPIIGDGKYDWTKRKLEMRQFYFDSQSFCKKKSIILIIHGMKNRDNVGIDIGVGFTDLGFLLNLFKKRETSCNLNKVFKLKKELNKIVKTTIGKYFTAIPKENAVHFFNYDSIQLEFSRELRRNKNLNQTVLNIAEALLKME